MEPFQPFDEENTRGVFAEKRAFHDVVVHTRAQGLDVWNRRQEESFFLLLVIAGAGGAAHLPGMIASVSPLPVIGVPVKSSNSIDGWDSVLSILQMPGGVPVATVALNGAKNAGILAAQIVGTSEPEVLKKVSQYKQELKTKVINSSKKLNP